MTHTLHKETVSKDGFCLWEVENFEFRIGLLGTGAGFTTILDLIASKEYQDFLPPLRLEALVVGPQNNISHKRSYIRSLKVPIYHEWRTMLEKHPRINLVVDVSGFKFNPSEIRKALPDNVSFMDHDTSIFFCGLHNMFQTASHCKVDLDQRKILLDAIISNIREDILLLDKDYRVMDLNPNVSNRIGKSKEEIIGKHCWDAQALPGGDIFCPKRDKQCPVATTLFTKKKAESLLTRVSNDGHLLYYRVYSYPVFNAQGELAQVLVMRRNITSRTHKEKQVQEKEKLSILASMSMYLAHEIRNPLCVIGGFTKSLLKSSNLSEQERAKIRIVEEETAKLDNVLQNILNFTRRDAKKFGEIDLNGVVKETLELIEIGYNLRGHVFQVNLAEEIPLLKGKPDVLKQCILNLVKNAMEATPDGSEIVIETGLSEDKLRISIADTGVGMDEDEIEMAFSPFHTTKSKGYGLGLPMIRKAVEEFGGQIDLQSQKGVGTKVTLTFPPVLELDETPAILSV
ncbi:two-component system sensor histidine kinase NtrB [Desulfoplanes sp.]